MILNYFNKKEFPLTREKEMEIHSKSYYGRFGNDEKFHEFYLSSSYPGLALYALENGFRAKLYQQYSTFRYSPLWPRNIFNDMIRIYKLYLNMAQKIGLETEIGEFSLEELIENLENDIPSIVLIKENSAFHNLVFHGFDEKYVYLIDPLKGYKSMKKSSFEKALNSIPFGKVALSVWR